MELHQRHFKEMEGFLLIIKACHFSRKERGFHGRRRPEKGLLNYITGRYSGPVTKLQVSAVTGRSYMSQYSMQR